MMTAIWPGGRRRGVEKGNGPFRRGPGILGGRGVVEEFEATLHARCLHRRLNLAVALGDGVNHQPDAGAGVGVMNPFGGGDEHLLGALPITDRDLLDRAAHGASRLVRFQQQLDLCLRSDGVWRHIDPLRRPRCPAELSECKSSATAAPDLRGQVRGLQQAVFRKILGIDIANRPLMDDAQAGAEVIAGIDPLHLALLDADRLVALALDEELDEIRARSQRPLDHAVHEGLLE